MVGQRYIMLGVDIHKIGCILVELTSGAEGRNLYQYMHLPRAPIPSLWPHHFSVLLVGAGVDGRLPLAPLRLLVSACTADA